MSQQVETRDLLARAFRGFQQAAVHLEQGHSALRQEVARLERELLDTNRRLEAVLDALDTGVAVLSAEGDVLRSNRAFEEMEIDGRELAPLGGGTARIRRRTPRGERDLALTVRPVRDHEETRVLTVQDVTEVRREEERGGRLRRLEAMGRMAAELAHEVRNPLGSIRLFASMLRDDLSDRPESREMAGYILEASASLEATVSNLLAFASPPRAQTRRVDLGEVASAACSLLAPTCRARGVGLEGPEPGAAGRVWADPEAMRRVVLNLLGNALAATGEGGTIRVSVTREEERALLTVEDTGQGISPEDLSRVFDPFFSRNEGGTGLGLSVVHGIVERHRGTISLDSQPGRGTLVRVEIPAERLSEETDA